MESIFSLKVTPLWIILILATAVSWEFGHGFGFGSHHNYATVAVVLIAFIKVRFVFLDFMELRAAPLPLRLAFESWAVLVGGTIIGLYWPGS
ncbi:MAG: cytochrome C oxidase subunit IV family protein [Gammaproteobacteria bacterium]|nr:cytochrome C oxidase subunit IV family protein [Gammaproteobacteria bacterium]